MRILVDWLAEFVEIPDRVEELAERLTDIGLEVDGIIDFSQTNREIVSVVVNSVEPHPEQDHLKICELTDGQREARVVTAAPGVLQEGKYLWAPPGSLVGGKQVSTRSFVGVESQGMLCSSRELGLTREASTLLSLPADTDPGISAVRLLELDSPILELDLTPNRGDCLSHFGVARDYAAAEKLRLIDPRPEQLSGSGDSGLEITILDTESCPAYAGVQVENLQVAPSPLKIQTRILKTGLRPLNNLVDYTNYTLFELGHPLHPFDADRLNYPIIVRKARQGEKLVTLDGESRQLSADDLVIADKSQPRALAGVMGGASSQVTENTSNIMLEAACFDPIGIRQTANRHKLSTDASHRFERGVDRVDYKRALARCLQLLQQDPAQDREKLSFRQPVIEQPGKYCPVKVSFKPVSFEKLIGYSLSETAIKERLINLGITVVEKADSWRLEIPSWLGDLTRSEDIIEELVRLDGYQNIPVTYPQLSVERTPVPDRSEAAEIREYFINQGFNENINFSFIPEAEHYFGGSGETLKLANPLSSSQATMRRALLDSLLTSFEKNYAAGNQPLRLFELGTVFKPEVAGSQFNLAVILHDTIYTEEWDDNNRPVDFFDIKGLIEGLLQQLGYRGYNFSPACASGFVEGETARLEIAGKSIGLLGKVEEKILQNGRETAVYAVELEVSSLPDRRQMSYQEYSSHPAAKRDLDLVVDESQQVGEMLELVRQKSRWLEELKVFDLYSGPPLPEDKKSVSFRLKFRAEGRSLNDVEVNQVQEQILQALRERFGAYLRDG